MPKLYTYNHCPYCTRVRLALGYLKVDFEEIHLGYQDSETPISLTGKKALPIFVADDGEAMGESLDIIKKLDKDLALYVYEDHNFEKDLDSIEPVITEISEVLHPVAIPYWIELPEFKNTEARLAFLSKHEKKRGSLSSLLEKLDENKENLLDLLEELEPLLADLSANPLNIVGIVLAAHLWAVPLIGDFEAPEKVRQFLSQVSAETGVAVFAAVTPTYHH